LYSHEDMMFERMVQLFSAEVVNIFTYLSICQRQH